MIESTESTAAPTADAVVVRRLTGAEARALAPALAEVLVECVNGGAGVSFLAPLAPATAEAFWRGVAGDVEAGSRILLVAEDGATGTLLGTVHLILAWQENSPHRAEVSKVLVRRAARRRGLGERLMRAADDAARAAGRTLLVLDTVTGSDAERLYARLGWTRMGAIPNYALMPDGRPESATFFYKEL